MKIMIRPDFTTPFLLREVDPPEKGKTIVLQLPRYDRASVVELLIEASSDDKPRKEREDKIENCFISLLEELQDLKRKLPVPNSVDARYLAIEITDVEKVFAHYSVFVGQGN